MWWLVSSMAFGQEVLHEDTVGTEIKEVVINADQTVVAFLQSSNGQVHLMSEKDWEITTIDACDSSAGGLAFDTSDILYVGCDGEGVVSIDTTDDNEVSTDAIAVDADAFMALATYNDDLYVLAENSSGGNPRIHLVDLEAQAESTGSFPTTLSFSSVADFERVGSFLVVSHSGANLSKVDPTSGGVTRGQNGPTTGSVDDIMPDEVAANALVAAGSAGVFRFQFSLNQPQLAASGADLDNVTALIAEDEIIWVADSGSDSLKSFTFSSDAETMGTEIQTEIDLELGSSVQEMGLLGDYIIVGAESGDMKIVGSGPWVDGGAVSPSSLTGEEEFSFAFTSTHAGDFEVRLNADSDTGGTVISSGTVEADTAVSLTLVSSDSYKEGANGLRIVVTSDEDGSTGHDTVYVTVDTPPSAPNLTAESVGFGDERITVSFDGIEDADLDYYIVYISETEFTADEYATGGPSFDNISEADRTITAEPSEAVSLTLTGLVNDQTYYVGVRAYDEGGAESDMSSIFSATPQETFSAAELSGETGGFCGISTQAGILSLGVAMILVGLRRKEALLGLAILVFPQVGEATTQVAAAVDDEEKIEDFRQFSDVRYGPITFTHDAINYVFTDSNHQILYFDTGYTYRDIIGVSLGLGLVREKGYLVDSTGAASSTEDTLSVIPLNVSGIIRADFFEDQLIVPYASAGYDHWIWREKWGDKDAGTDGSLSGDKQGWHYALGGQILLDPFDKVSASLMEAKRGIRDTYLSVEYRNQTFDQDGIDFDSDSYTIGFCFTY